MKRHSSFHLFSPKHQEILSELYPSQFKSQFFFSIHLPSKKSSVSSGKKNRIRNTCVFHKTIPAFQQSSRFHSICLKIGRRRRASKTWTFFAVAAYSLWFPFLLSELWHWNPGCVSSSVVPSMIYITLFTLLPTAKLKLETLKPTRNVITS